MSKKMKVGVVGLGDMGSGLAKNLINNGFETRHELLLGFSESTENKWIFSDMTGFW